MQLFERIVAGFLLFILWVVWVFSALGLLIIVTSGGRGDGLGTIAAVFFAATCVLAIVQAIAVHSRSIKEAIEASPGATAEALRAAAKRGS